MSKYSLNCFAAPCFAASCQKIDLRTNTIYSIIEPANFGYKKKRSRLQTGSLQLMSAC